MKRRSNNLQLPHAEPLLADDGDAQHLARRMRTKTLDGLTVRIAEGSDGDGGSDGPVVVLLHGYGALGDDGVGLAYAPGGTSCRAALRVSRHTLWPSVRVRGRRRLTAYHGEVCQSAEWTLP